LLRRDGYDVTVLDDLSTGHRDSLPADVRFVEGSVLDAAKIADALTDCQAVMHFAAKSLVPESVAKPDLYHDVNVNGSKNLLAQMKLAGVNRLVFSSTAATYGEPEVIPITESSKTNPTSPYGATKLEVDQAITEAANSDGVAAISLRYFNVVGGIKLDRGWISERHTPETHLIPNLLRSTSDNPIKIFGNDWPTKDGTCIRDYIHVVDLIGAHIAALKAAKSGSHEIINLGSGSGYSILEVIAAASAALGTELPYEMTARRAGDPAVLVADISKARTLLGWQPTRDLAQMVSDTYEAARG
jgi:UDP-glucose 4-epimerase